MGGYLGRVRLCLPSLTVSTGDLQKRPSPPVHYISRSLQVNSMDEYLNMADSSRSFEDDEALADSQEHSGRVVVVHMQRYPVEKAWDSLVGVFSSMFLCGQHNSVPTLSAPRMPRISMILKVVSTKGRATLRFVLAQPVLIIWSFLTGYLSTQSRKGTQMSALQQSSKSKRAQAKKKKDLTTLGKGEGFAKQEEDSPVTTKPSDQGKDSDGDVSAPSAFRRLIVNGVLSSFIPRPGLLGRDICSKNSAKSCIKESQTAFKSSYKRNAIASSYSSTLAQWPSERIRVRGTRGTAVGTASGAATGAAAHATREAAPDAAAGDTRATAAGAAPSTATGTAAGAAPGAAAGVASDAASGAAAGAAPGDAARATQGASPGAASGTATGAFGCATQGASPGIAPGAVPDDVSGAAPSAASGAVADAAPGAVSGDALGALPLPSPALSQLKAKAAKKGKKKGRAASGNPVPGSVPDDLLLPSPASSQSKAAAKKVSEKDPAASGNPKRKGKKNKKKNKKVAATDAQVKQGDPRDGLPAPDIPKPVRRKIPLLLPYRRDVPLILPPPPELCFRITAEDFDLEKKTSMQWINKILKDDGAKARCN